MNINVHAPKDLYGNRAQLAEVADALRALHKTLLDSLRVSFEKLHGRIAGAGAFLQLVLHDPLFAWLRPISALIAELDDIAGDDDSIVDKALLMSVRKTIEGWILVSDPKSEIARSYRVLLQSDPSVILAHGALRQSLASLPAPPRQDDEKGLPS